MTTDPSGFNRKRAKKKSMQVVKTHYVLLVILCVFSSVFGIAHTTATSAAEMFIGLDRVEGKLSGNASTQVSSMSSVVTELMNGRIEKAEQKAGAQIEADKEKDTRFGGLEFGRQGGILAGFVNNFTSGKLFVTVVSAIDSVIGSKKISAMIFIVFALAIVLFIWIFFINIFRAVMARFFLEARIYKNVSVNRVTFFWQVAYYRRACLTMALKYLYEVLWSFTIVGYFIKFYAYAMVPYIVAENPSVRPNEAITLSRRMMKGHKWEMFVWRFTFIGWRLLNILTFGLLEFFYVGPYMESMTAEYYAYIRSLARHSGIPGSEKLNDQYLFSKAEEALLSETYADIHVLIAEDKLVHEEKMKPLAAFFAKVFGVVLYYSKEEKEHRENALRKVKIENYRKAIEGEMYPLRLAKFKIREKRARVENVDYLRRYSLASLVAMFFIFAFIGWSWEVLLHIVKDGVFVNRGMLHGPWLPIYGSGGAMILVALFALRKWPAAEFSAAVVLCGIVEYFTSYFVEIAHDGMKWWDYSGYFLNINGRICAEGLLVFGLGGVAIVYVLGPHLDDLLQKIRLRILAPILAVLVIAFTADAIWSHHVPNQGKGITDYGTEEAKPEDGEEAPEEIEPAADLHQKLYF